MSVAVRMMEMVHYRKAFRSSIQHALSAEKVREREKEGNFKGIPRRHPIVSEKAINQSKSLTKSDEERV